MSTMGGGETFYALHSENSHDHPQDLTPYSAVSSFNLPHNCDSSLITPVSLSQSLSVDTTAAVSQDMDIKLSPSNSSISPNYDMFIMDDEFGDSKYNPPMKYKHHISTSDASFPSSPLVPCTPYWGAFGVSATAVSRSDSSSSLNPSPIGPPPNSASGLRNHGNHLQQHQGQMYRHRASVPLLIAPRAPSPSSRRTTLPQLNSFYRNNSLQSIDTNTSPTLSSNTPYSAVEGQSLTPIRRRRKPPKHSHEGEHLLSNDMTHDERVLMQLTVVDHLPWKEVVVRFKELTGKSLKVPALQMRKKRLVERLRVWTPSDARALVLAFQDQHKLKWDQIAQAMLKYGCAEKWSREMVQKKWHEMHPDVQDFCATFERDTKHQIWSSGEFGMDDWSDSRQSVSHSSHGSDSRQLSAI